LILLVDQSSCSEIDISWGVELAIVDTPNIIYCSDGDFEDFERREKALLEMIKRKNNRFFYLITTPKMRRESSSFIQKLVDKKKELQNYKFLFVDEDRDPDEVILEQALDLCCPIISNDKFQQKKYDKFRSKNIEIWSFKLRNSDSRIKIKEKWKL